MMTDKNYSGGLSETLKTVGAVIFDLDNTILDSHLAWREVDAEFFRKRGLTEPEGYGRAVAAMTFREAAVYSAKILDLNESVEDIMNEWFESIHRQYAEELRIFDGVAELLQKLHKRGCKIGLATAATEQLYAPALEHNGILQYFDAFATTNETKRGKGFPDVYLLAAERLGISPVDCMVFEDILIGIKAAGSGGMMTCAFLNPFTSAEHDELCAFADFSFGDYRSLI